MVFNNTSIIISFSLAFLWLALLSVFFFGLYRHYNRLVGNSPKTELKKILDRLIDEKTDVSKHLAILEKQIKKVESDSMFHIQKIGVVRYNPFSDTGGSQSFSLALLDREKNGIILTSLYARTGNRWYIKYIEKGNAEEIGLSKEEKMAIEKAMSDRNH